MRTMARNLAWIGLVGAGAAVYIGCGTAYDDFYVELTNPKYASGSGSGTSSSSTTTSGSSSGTGGMAPDCTGDPSETNVIDACGVFVQADAAGATEDGTQAHPYKTLQKAIDNAGAKRVYACDSAPYAETVTVAAPVEMYGGFDCAKGWGWTAAGRSVLNGPEGAVTLTIAKQGSGSMIEGFAISAASATKKGESSVAVAVDDVDAGLMNCDVTAGDGMLGDDGATPSGIATKGADAPAAMTSNACVAPNQVIGGVPGTTTCGDGTTAGGVGGTGGITGTNNGDGQPGADGAPMDAADGLGGAGESATKCKDGLTGKDGDPGTAGVSDISPGTLALSGLLSSDNTDGMPGFKGHGGGGGGGAKSGLFCLAGMSTVDGVGASGGGGGAGGCGGQAGGGGKAGGSSIAILSLGTKLTLTEVSLKTGKGGDGGKGAIGQSGGDPGLGATGGAKSGIGASKPGCKGGDGGLGGLGGPGGGGRGGHSVGIAYVNAPSKAPVLKGFTGDTEGSGGTAGPGNMMGNGAAGAKGACWDFTTNLACAK